MRLRQTILSAIVLLGLSTAAQADEVVFDDWFAVYEGGVKIGWHHIQLTKHDSGYSGSDRHWRRVGDALIKARSETETDSNGRILRIRSASEAPWGKSTFELGPGEGGLVWKLQTRDLPVKTGSLKAGVIWAPRVICARVIAGELPPGKRQIRVFDQDKGSEARDWSCEFDEEEQEWHISGPGGTGVRTKAGRYISGTTKDKPAATEQAVEEAQAPVLDVKGKLPKLEGPLVAKDRLESAGVRITRLDPTWQLFHRELEGGIAMLGVESGHGAAVVAMRMPFSLPEDMQRRKAMVEALRTRMNESDEMTLAAPEPAPWRGEQVLRMSLSGESDGEPHEGKAYMLRAGEGSLLVMFMWPTDRAKELLAERMRLEQALQFVTPPSAKPKLQDVEAVAAGLGLTIPSGWVGQPELSPSRWLSPMGGSQIHVNTGNLGPGIDLPTGQEAWFQQQANNPALQVKVEVADEVKVAGKRAYRLILSGTFSHEGITTPYRAATLAFPQPNNGFVEVVVIALGLDWDVKAVDEVLKSVKFLENH